MLELHSFEKSLTGKRILVTGHTGFTGGWVCSWLNLIGANVAGFALNPDTTPSLYNELRLDNQITSYIGDITNYDDFYHAVRDFQPEVIMHLAAQPLVRRSYREPVRTFLVNTQGTVHLLDISRKLECVKAVLCITTDKVYRNNEWIWAYRENDALGGKDPYSASKAAAELVINSFVASYSSTHVSNFKIATARGGNIIGGGDWSEDRLIPDFVRAVHNNQSLTMRYPLATRPWQHVLALIHGYFLILSRLVGENPDSVTKAWNFGPHDVERYSVKSLFEIMGENWKLPNLDYIDNPLPEARALAVDSAMARLELGWMPPWDTRQMIKETANWYKSYYKEPEAIKTITLEQILKYRSGI